MKFNFSEKNIVILGCVRDCAPYLTKSLQNAERIGKKEWLYVRSSIMDNKFLNSGF